MKNDLLLKLPIAAAVLLYIVICLVMPAKYGGYFALSRNKTEVVINEGISARDAAIKIEDAGIVKDYKSLVKWMIKYNIDRKKTGYLPQIREFDASFPISVYDLVISGLTDKKNLFRKFKMKNLF